MDQRRHDIALTLEAVRQQLDNLREDLAQGPTPKWVDSEGRTATEHWASWGLVVTRGTQLDLRALERIDLQSLLTAEEVVECDSHRREVAQAHATFTAAGGHMLPVDFPDQ